MQRTLMLGAGFLLATAMLAATGNLTPLKVKPGLWQVTTTSTINGLGGIASLPPDEQAKFAQMSPQQRAAVEAMIKKQYGSGPQTRTYKNCVTQKDIDDTSPWGSGDKCTWNVITSTGTDLEAEGTSCDLGKNDGLTSKIHIKMHVSNSENVQASMDGSATGNGHTYTMNGSYTGKWLGATCPAGTQ
jgi:hypothetical protein